MFVARETSAGWRVEFAKPEGPVSDGIVLCRTASLRWRAKAETINVADACLTWDAAQAIADRKNGITRR